MSGLTYIYYIIKYRLDLAFNRIEKRKINFPKEVDTFKLVKVLNNKSVTGFFSFALYKNSSGEKVFCKGWFGQSKNIGYYWLKNETGVYDFLSKQVKDNKIRIPKYFGYYENKKSSLLFIEYINGKNVRYLHNKEKLSVYESVINYFGSINKNYVLTPDNALIVLKQTDIQLSFLFLITSTFIKYPNFRKMLIKIVSILVINRSSLNKSLKLGFVHRDIVNNIYKMKGKYYVTDFQVSVVSVPLLELANFSLGLFKMKSLYESFRKSIGLYAPIGNKDNQILYKFYCLHAALYDLNIIHNTKAKNIRQFIENTWNL
jgi:hypothetical protein